MISAATHPLSPHEFHYWAIAGKIHFLAVSKMVTPIARERRKEEPSIVPTEDTAKVDEGGDVIISAVQYMPSSAGREKFGDTISWN